MCTVWLVYREGCLFFKFNIRVCFLSILLLLLVVIPVMGIIYKVGPEPVEKNDSIPKFTVWIKNLSWLITTQIWQYIFKISVQKYLNKAFFIPNLGIFILTKKFAIRLIWELWFQIWQCYFQILVQKYPNQIFLIPYLKILIFAPNFTLRQIGGHWFKVWH